MINTLSNNLEDQENKNSQKEGNFDNIGYEEGLDKIQKEKNKEKKIQTKQEKKLKELLNKKQIPSITRRPLAMVPFTEDKYNKREKIDFIPDINIDLRSYDLRDLNLTNNLSQLKKSRFDGYTQWPDTLPENFNPEKIMEINKNPGLGIRKLHTQGITGKGVNIAIIDTTLLVDHKEYKNNVQLYDEAKNMSKEADMHGAAVASIAVGKSIGVAPESELYYIGGLGGGGPQDTPSNIKNTVESINGIIEQNKKLPENKKIKVLSMSILLDKNKKGYEKIMDSIKKAKKSGIFVITGDLDETDGYSICGLTRNPLEDNTDDTEAYTPAPIWKNKFYENSSSFFAEKNKENKILFVPMGSRTIASATGTDEYLFTGTGGVSRAVPYMAGVYALACQIYPRITPKIFLEIATKTGTPVREKGLDLGKIINPTKIIDEVKQLQ